VFGLGGVAVSADRLVLGVARGIGWGVKDMALRGRGLDPDYREVVAAALDALVEVDVVLAHVEAPAEMSLAGDATGKVCAIEEIDEFVVGPLRAWCEQAEDRRLMVLTDRVVHTAGQTDVDAANHSTPFVISRQRVASARVCPFHEKGAAFSGMVVEQGHELLEYFLKR
jgi:2,3-bisphosphoglycerate-independent phosphoglycerate mutase